MSDISDQLQCIYSILRKMKRLRPKQRDNEQDNTTSLQPDNLFPKVFLLKLLDERFEDLSQLGRELANKLFKQIGGQPKRLPPDDSVHLEDNLPKRPAAIQRADHRPSAEEARFADLEEYFHYCLYHLHDFLIDFNWYEPDIDILSETDHKYVETNLPFMASFFRFQTVLGKLIQRSSKTRSSNGPSTPRGSVATTKSTSTINEFRQLGAKSNMKSEDGGSSKSSAGSPGFASSIKTLKSSLSSMGADSPRADSPATRRRVRFKLEPSSPSIKSSKTLETIRELEAKRLLAVNRRELRENHSVFALNLLVYAINMFIQHLSDRLVEWTSGPGAGRQLGELIEQIIAAKQRLRANQLGSIARRMKVNIDVHLTVLEYMNEIKSHYIVNNIIGTLITRDSERIYNVYKRPRIEMYLQRIGLDVDSKILLRLANQFLQLWLDLLVSQINVSPVADWADRRVDLKRNKRKLRDGAVTPTADKEIKGRENVVNFIASWLNIDDVLFGFARPKLRDEASLKTTRGTDKTAAAAAATQNDDDDLHYKSSSRIMVQMENLAELLRDFLVTTTSRIKYHQQLEYFLELICEGLEQSFDLISQQLMAQQQQQQQQQRQQSSKQEPNPTKDESNANTNTADLADAGGRAISASIDSMAVKVRCLKLVQAMSLANRLLEEISTRERVKLIHHHSLEAKLGKFSENCTRKAS